MYCMFSFYYILYISNALEILHYAMQCLTNQKSLFSNQTNDVFSIF